MLHLFELNAMYFSVSIFWCNNAIRPAKRKLTLLIALQYIRYLPISLRWFRAKQEDQLFKTPYQISLLLKVRVSSKMHWYQIVKSDQKETAIGQDTTFISWCQSQISVITGTEVKTTKWTRSHTFHIYFKYLVRLNKFEDWKGRY